MQRTTLDEVTFDIIGNNNHVLIGEGATLIKTSIRIRGNDHTLVIGKKCNIRGSLWFEDSNCKIIIGDNTTARGCGLAALEPNSSIIIGNDCMISHGVNIRSSDSHSIIDLETNKRINYAEDIYIGDHVWIGANVQILKGVTIGNDSIIATRSVVSRSIPKNCIAAGIPAKAFRNNVTWKRQRIYEDENVRRKAIQA